MNGTNQNWSLVKSELRYYFIRLTIFKIGMDIHQLFTNTLHMEKIYIDISTTTTTTLCVMSEGKEGFIFLSYEG